MASMGDREDFLDWFNTTWRAAEDALHNGDAAPRFASPSPSATNTFVHFKGASAGRECGAHCSALHAALSMTPECGQRSRAEQPAINPTQSGRRTYLDEVDFTCRDPARGRRS